MTTFRRDVGEVLWFGIEGAELSAERTAQLARGDAGGVTLFKRNLVLQPGGAGASAQEVCDLERLVELNRALHSAAPSDAPLLISIDQEGGTVQRVRAPATQWPPMMAFDGLAAPEDARLAEQVGLALGRELAALGLDIDFAPVLDVHTNPANPVIGQRAFATEPDKAARRALALARGLEAGGVLGCGKHFPGHGDTSTDSHLALPRIDHDLTRLERIEFVPFVAAARADVPMIMTAHVVFAAIDDQVPATLSPKAITGLLRQRLGYRGVIVSDDLDMHAIAANFGIGDAAVLAIRAGCDVLLCCQNVQHQLEAREALIHAAEKRSEVRDRLAESAARMRALKVRAAKARAAAGPRTLHDVGAIAHRRLADQLSGRA
jgi:beta-N-acetylhexosaminidase